MKDTNEPESKRKRELNERDGRTTEGLTKTERPERVTKRATKTEAKSDKETK